MKESFLDCIWVHDTHLGNDRWETTVCYTREHHKETVAVSDGFKKYVSVHNYNTLLMRERELTKELERKNRMFQVLLKTICKMLGIEVPEARH